MPAPRETDPGGGARRRRLRRAGFACLAGFAGTLGFFLRETRRLLLATRDLGAEARARHLEDHAYYLGLGPLWAWIAFLLALAGLFLVLWPGLAERLFSPRRKK